VGRVATPTEPTSAEQTRAVFEAKARAELAAADLLVPGSDAISWRGFLVPAVAVVKGRPGPAEASGGAAVSGADGEAVAKALEKLCHDPEQAFYTLSRPVSDAAGDAGLRRLRLQIEAVDAPLVLALDAEAAADLASAFELDALGFGVVVRGKGRRFVACDGLERSLNDDRAKARVWRQLMVATPEVPVY
jgi:hypothetical protein